MGTLASSQPKFTTSNAVFAQLQAEQEQRQAGTFDANAAAKTRKVQQPSARLKL